jgi:hypothetical protein
MFAMNICRTVASDLAERTASHDLPAPASSGFAGIPVGRIGFPPLYS